MRQDLRADARMAIDRFLQWLDGYGETSYDHQTFYASPVGGKAKNLYYRCPSVGILAVAPFVFSEAFFPSARKIFWKRQRLPIADAHYAMGFARLARLTGVKDYFSRAVHFLEVLINTRCPEYERYGWGYPFNWVTRNGTIPAGIPLITTTPYAFEAFQEVHRIDGNPRWLGILRSIAEHAAIDIKDFQTSEKGSSCSYTPHDQGGVVNASAYRACLLTSAACLFSEDRYLKIAERNVNFVLESQNADGSWPYAVGDPRDFIDHFHTCFVLKGLAKIERLTNIPGCREAISRGVEYYVGNLFDGDGLPRPFAKAPRLTVYRHELYDYAECINLGVLLEGRFRELDRTTEKVVEDVLWRWQKPDGSFRSRKLLLGWDDVPMHRWAQSQIFRSLSLLIPEEEKIPGSSVQGN